MFGIEVLITGGFMMFVLGLVVWFILSALAARIAPPPPPQNDLSEADKLRMLQQMAANSVLGENFQFSEEALKKVAEESGVDVDTVRHQLNSLIKPYLPDNSIDQ